MSHRLLIPLVFSTVLIGCASPGVVVVHEPAPDITLSTYRSYHLVVTPPEQASSTDWMVEKAIHDDLRAKGYVPVDRGAADLVVTYEADIQDDSTFDTSHSLDGSMKARKSADKHIDITMIDPRRERPVWRGTARGEVHPGRITASVQSALADILAGVPPRS